jgi:hypothetical protein
MYVYSQCGEDLFLYNTFFKNKQNGTYIELGALDGNLYSTLNSLKNNLDGKVF